MRIVYQFSWNDKVSSVLSTPAPQKQTNNKQKTIKKQQKHPSNHVHLWNKDFGWKVRPVCINVSDVSKWLSFPSYFILPSSVNKSQAVSADNVLYSSTVFGLGTDKHSMDSILILLISLPKGGFYTQEHVSVSFLLITWTVRPVDLIFDILFVGY